MAANLHACRYGRRTESAGEQVGGGDQAAEGRGGQDARGLGGRGEDDHELRQPGRTRGQTNVTLAAATRITRALAIRMSDVLATVGE